MRAPERKRPRKRVISVPPDVDLEGVAARVSYVGSPEHKEISSFEGRLVNRGDGSYKGYQLGDDEWPDGINELYGET